MVPIQPVNYKRSQNKVYYFQCQEQKHFRPLKFSPLTINNMPLTKVKIPIYYFGQSPYLETTC